MIEQLDDHPRGNVATAHQFLLVAYHILRAGIMYQEKGGDYFD